ncbi:MAG: heme-binding protein [Candidatus Korobacteraceae bacterium]
MSHPSGKAGVRYFSLLSACSALLVVSLACGGGSSSSGTSLAAGGDPPAPPAPATSSLTAAQVDAVVHAAVQSVNVPIVVGVTDRLGNILAVFATNGAPATGSGNFGTTPAANDLAVALARTGAFFSNDAAPLSSRTVRYISGIHFPPGVAGTANAPLYGIENTNRGCSFNTTYLPGQAIPPATLIDGRAPGLGIITGKANIYDSDPTAVNPGGVPLFENGTLVGGVGVVAAPTLANSMEIAEYAAFTAATTAPFGPTPAPPGVVVINGIALPFVDQTTIPSGVTAGSFNGSYSVGPSASPGPPPDGYLVGPMASAFGGLTRGDVMNVVNSAIATASQTRAAIRLPIGSRARMMIAVSDLDGNLLAVYRMPDATIFSIDVAVAKSRNVVYFSNSGGLPGAYAGSMPGSTDLPGIPEGTAVTNRTISFGAQPLFPSGIDNTPPGPFFNLYVNDTANACTQGTQPKNPYQNGIVFFPGSLPLYRNGVLVGGLGVSGDGVDQDDFVTAGGAALMTLTDPSDSGHGFEAPTAIRADEVVIDNVRLPYIKFPRNPTQ